MADQKISARTPASAAALDDRIAAATGDPSFVDEYITNQQILTLILAQPNLWSAIQSKVLSAASTNTVLRPVVIGRNTSSSPAAGIGVGIEFQTQVADGANTSVAYLDLVSTDVGAGSEDFDLVLSVATAGAAPAEVFRINSVGNLTLSGTVDGRDVNADGTKLDGVESGSEVNTVTLAGAETLTNKIIDIDSNTIQNVGNSVLQIIGSPTYSTIQDMQNTFHSSGSISGGVITDAGSNTIDVTAGTGFIRATDSGVAEILFFDWPQSLGLSVPSGATRYVGVEYNAGTPQVVVRTSDDFDYHTDFILGVAVNDAGTIHIGDTPHLVGDHAGNMIHRSHQTMGIARDNELGGIIIGETGTRNITITAGALWDRLTRFVIPALDTSVSDTFDRYYSDGASGFTKQSAQTTWNNTQYDDGSGTLVTLSTNKFGVQWFYTELNGDLISMYGTATHNSLSSAEDELPPSDVPDRVSKLSILVGRVIFQESGSAAESIESAFISVFSGNFVTDHGSFGGLGDDDHIIYLLADGSRILDLLNLGHATDTTLTRLAAGILGVEGSRVIMAADNGDVSVSKINLLDYGEVTNAIGSIGGGAQTIDLTLGNIVVATVDTSTTTFTFSNPTASDEGCSFTLVLTNGGSQTVNWPASVDWAGATAPILTTAGVDVLEFFTVDGGTIWNGFVAGLDMS